jgi:hypothetical protein
MFERILRLIGYRLPLTVAEHKREAWAMTCAQCKTRPFGRPVTIVRADADHDLCQRCYRSARERQRALELRAAQTLLH